MALWGNGDIDTLLREGEAIQSNCARGSGTAATGPTKRNKLVSKLMLEGKVKAALRLLESADAAGILDATPEVHEILKSKHPSGKPLDDSAMPRGPVDDIPDVFYESISADDISILGTQGGAGPSGLDAVGVKRLLSKKFRVEAKDLCEALAVTTRILCSKTVDPYTISPLLSNRLIALDKQPGVRPLGIGECFRRVIAKTVTRKFSAKLQDAAGPLQLAAGHMSDAESAVHATNKLFDSEETDGILLVDAENAFNLLNRQIALRNIQVSCPIVGKFAVNRA